MYDNTTTYVVKRFFTSNIFTLLQKDRFMAQIVRNTSVRFRQAKARIFMSYKILMIVTTLVTDTEVRTAHKFYVLLLLFITKSIASEFQIIFFIIF